MGKIISHRGTEQNAEGLREALEAALNYIINKMIHYLFFIILNSFLV
jgi:hypothetical protein